jgi:hypothetical protein
MRRYVLLAAVAVVGPAFADEPAPRVENLLPLAVGNSWTYKVSTQDDPRFGPRVQDDRFVVRVVRQEMVGEQTCFRLDASLKDRVVATEHLAFTKDGLCRFRVDKDDVVPPVCVLKQPAPRSGQWRQSYKVGGRQANSTLTVSNGDLTVLGKKYKAVTVEASVGEPGPGRPPSTRTVISYADGVGIVRQEVIGGKGSLVLELERFETEPEK